jgi:bacterioferritin-associated ferredoxin
MIICLCEGANERDVQECIDAGCKTIKELAQKHNICADCKKCCHQLKEILEKEKECQE